MAAEVAFLVLMFMALIGVLFSGVPAMIAIGGVPLIAALLAGLAGGFDLALLGAFPQRLYGIMGNQLLIAIPLFILMGVLIERSGLAEAMMREAQRLSGGKPAPMVLGVLLMSTLIAATTGVVGATIVMLAMISFPALIQSGVSRRLASGAVLSAGTLGQIIPPSIVLIILADQVSNAFLQAQRENGIFAVQPVTVSDLFAGAVLPGLMLAACYAGYALWRLRGTEQIKAVETSQTPNTSGILLFLPVALIVLVMGAILAGVATPTEAAALGAVGTLLIAGLRPSGGPYHPRSILPAIVAAFAVFLLAIVPLMPAASKFPIGSIAAVTLGVCLVLASVSLLRSAVLLPAVWETALLSGMIFGIVIAAAMLSLVFRGLGGDDLLAGLATGFPGGSSGFLIAVLFAVFLLGFVLEFIEIVLIVVPIAGPVLFASGVDPVWFAILLAVNLQTSFLTPPFGVALFYFRSAAPADLPIVEIYRSVIPFVLLQLAVLLAVYTVPEIALWLPAMLFGG